MDQDQDFFSEKDKNSAAYMACVAGTTITGMAVGRFAGLQGLLAGGIAGAVVGLLVCRQLTPAIKRKLFSRAEVLSDSDIVSLTGELQKQHPQLNRSEALNLLANIQLEIIKNPGEYRSLV